MNVWNDADIGPSVSLLLLDCGDRQACLDQDRLFDIFPFGNSSQYSFCNFAQADLFLFILFLLQNTVVMILFYDTNLICTHQRIPLVLSNPYEKPPFVSHFRPLSTMQPTQTHPFVYVNMSPLKTRLPIAGLHQPYFFRELSH